MYSDGLLKKGYDYIREMDADFLHDPADLVRLLDEVEDCDLCIGSKYISNAGVINWPTWREAPSVVQRIFM